MYTQWFYSYFGMLLALIMLRYMSADIGVIVILPSLCVSRCVIK
jgi:hypothetical protein